MRFQAAGYEPCCKEDWNRLIGQSRNATFLLRRDYLEYHSHRFEDASTVVRDGSGRIRFLFPASAHELEIRSHGGLTYGGLVVPEEASAAEVLGALEVLLEFYRARGARTLLYKPIPHFYHRRPAEEDLYALFRFGARLVRRDVSAVVAGGRRGPLQDRRRRGAKRARGAGLQCVELGEPSSFWPVLEENLATRHGLRPVHSCDEITMLAERFPTNIRTFGVSDGEGIEAGTVVFESPMVAHAQYIGSTTRGRELGALDLLFENLITETYAAKPWFDFGISTEADGLVLNEGLAAYKDGHGASTAVYDQYKIDV